MGVLHYDFKGMLYDEWELDRVYTTGARTICEADVARYCSLSGDYSPLYTNALYAENTVYGRPIAPGGLTFIIANGLDCQTLWWMGAISAFWTSRCASSGPSMWATPSASP